MQPTRNLRFVPAKNLAISILCHKYVGKLLATVFRNQIPYRGVKVYTRSPAVPAENKAGLFFGNYESAERRFVNQYLDPTLSTVELGASLGGVSSHIARRLNPGRQLFCVEANPQMLPLLEQNLKQNASHLQTKVFHAAVDYGGHSVSFSLSDDPLESKVGDSGANSFTVRAMPLLSVVEELEEPDYQLVSDIEGGELGILLNDQAALKRCALAIIEFHDVDQPGWNIERLREEWLQAGFDLVDKYGSVSVMRRRR